MSDGEKSCSQAQADNRSADAPKCLTACGSVKVRRVVKGSAKYVQRERRGLRATRSATFSMLDIVARSHGVSRCARAPFSVVQSACQVRRRVRNSGTRGS